MDATTGSKFQAPLSCRICRVTHRFEARRGPAPLSRTVAVRVIERVNHGLDRLCRLRGSLVSACTRTEYILDSAKKRV